MKKLFGILAAVVCLWGCEKMYIFTPMKVTLASEGQTMSIETSIQPQTLDIRDYYGNGTEAPEYDAETGTYTATGSFDSNGTSGHLLRTTYTPGTEEKAEWEFTLAKVGNKGYSRGLDIS